MKYTTTYEEQTKSVGRQLATMVSGGAVITLSGDLGAGKTTFTKGFAEGLGVRETITSPTFSLMNVYPTDSQTQIKQFVHIDTYRLEEEEDLRAIGAEDYLWDDNTVSIIEWPEKIPSLLAGRDVIAVTIAHQDGDERTISVQGIS